MKIFQDAISSKYASHQFGALKEIKDIIPKQVLNTMRNAELFQEELEGIEALILEHPTSKTFKRRQ